MQYHKSHQQDKETQVNQEVKRKVSSLLACHVASKLEWVVALKQALLEHVVLASAARENIAERHSRCNLRTGTMASIWMK